MERVRRVLIDNLKNIRGWRTADKLVVLAVDDYGNVRLDSLSAKERMRRAGLQLRGGFDPLDALETRQDLEALFGVLSSVCDRNGNHAVFTTNSLCANLDFDAMTNASCGYKYVPLTRTFERLAAEQPQAYDGAWKLCREGIRAGLLKPQFHGREHLNVELIERRIRARDRGLLISLANRSLTAVGAEPSMPGVGFTHAFGLWGREELQRHRDIIADGLQLFESVFGFRSVTFSPPASQFHPELYAFVESLGVRGIDKPSYCVRRLDRELKTRELNVLGCRNDTRHVSIVRNVVFEPIRQPAQDSVRLALNQIAAAFRWQKPAIVSSHRVNFAGHIDPQNRVSGLEALEHLLKEIVRRWPDVQFIGADELVGRIISSA